MGGSKMAVTMAILAGLLLSPAAVYAQNSGGAGMQNHRRIGTGTRLRDRDQLTTGAMDRRQDRLYERDLRSEEARDRIYGASLMSVAERAQYEERLRSLATERERVRFRMAHQQQMRRRAEGRHERLGAAPSEAQIKSEEHARQQEREQIYGYSMMTPQEVARYRARMDAARSEQERERIRSEHRRQLEDRVREQGSSPPQ